jgi:hypothetical protein
MTFFKEIHKGNGPKRLFVGGVHGKEGLTTINALSKIESKDVGDGDLVICNFEQSSYISTLDKSYYDSKIGKGLLSLIKKYEPVIYLELHCYHLKNYHRLTDENRKNNEGVPPLIELEEGVLMGSISPLIRTTFFKRYDFSFILETPCEPPPEAKAVYLEIIKMVAASRNRFEILKKLKASYPRQVEKAVEYFLDFSDKIISTTEIVKKEVKKMDLKDHQSIKNLVTEKSSHLELDLTEKQIEQIADAIIISKNR